MNELKHTNTFLHNLKMELLGKTPFERFEHVVLLFLTVVLSVIIMIALIRLVSGVYQLAISQFQQGSNFKEFQVIFGMLLTLLIVFEFRNSIKAAIDHKGMLVQVELVILIAIMALARKFVVLDSSQMSAGEMAALAGITVSLGVVYWLIKFSIKR